MKKIIALLAATFLAAPSIADDKKTERARKVKVALALNSEPTVTAENARTAKVAAALALEGEPSPKPFAPIPVAIPAPMPREVVRKTCDCDRTGECKCPAGACGCCEKALLGYEEQAKRAVLIGKPLVLYSGCRGRCVDGVLAAESRGEPGETPHVSVLIPKDNGNLWEAFRLPPDTTVEAIKQAVGAATKALAPKAAKPKAPEKVSAAPVPFGSMPTTHAPRAAGSNLSSTATYPAVITYTPAGRAGRRGITSDCSAFG